jgi:hypothetical protein
MSKISKEIWQQRLELYDTLIAKCPRFERKGKNMPYTSANGYMFSLLNKAGEIGIRFSKDVQEKYMNELNTTIYKSYGAVMRGYILIPEAVLKDADRVAAYLNESYDYVMSMEPNTSKKK